MRPYLPRARLDQVTTSDQPEAPRSDTDIKRSARSLVSGARMADYNKKGSNKSRHRVRIPEKAKHAPEHRSRCDPARAREPQRGRRDVPNAETAQSKK